MFIIYLLQVVLLLLFPSVLAKRLRQLNGCTAPPMALFVVQSVVGGTSDVITLIVIAVFNVIVTQRAFCWQ